MNTQSKLTTAIRAYVDSNILTATGDARTILEDIDHIVTALPELSDWIPVSERLPESSGDYLVWWRRQHGENRRVVMQFENGIFWKGHGAPVNVTHWQPLPAPPK